MKKTFLTIFLISVSFALFAKERMSVSAMKEIFNKKLPTHEFDVQNPLWKCNLYVTNLMPLKGKILHRHAYEYELNKNGMKSYGDAGALINDEYYFFDKDGFITDYYYIRYHEEDSVIAVVKHTSYRENDDKFIIENREKDLNKNTCEMYAEQKEVREYTMKKISVNEFQYLDSDGNPNIIFEKGEDCVMISKRGVSEPPILSSKKDPMTKTKIWDDFCEVTSFRNDAVNWVTTYQCGAQIKRRHPLPDGELIETYSNEPGIQTKDGFELRGENIRRWSSAMERRFYKECGFLEYELERPLVDGEPGWYSEKKCEIISEPDEVFKKYCTKK